MHRTTHNSYRNKEVSGVKQLGNCHLNHSDYGHQLTPQQILEEVRRSAETARQLLEQREGYLGEFWRLVDRFIFRDPPSKGYVPMPVLQMIFTQENSSQPWLQTQIFELEKDGKLEVKRLGKEGPIRAVRVIDL